MKPVHVFLDSSINSEKFVCKETFWWDGFEIVPPRPKIGLLSVFANRAAAGRAALDSESAVSDESTTEEFTEEETGSSTSLGSEAGSAESNPVPKKNVIKTKNKQRNGKLLWQHNMSARSNQDIQRAYEESLIREMSVVLSKKTVKDPLNLSKSSKPAGRCSTPTGGIWTRLEAEWRESLLSQREFISKSKNMTAVKQNKLRSRF